MGRAINNENDIEYLKREVAQLKTAFSGLSATVETLRATATTKRNIDLHKETDTKNVKAKSKKPKKMPVIIEEAEA